MIKTYHICAYINGVCSLHYYGMTLNEVRNACKDDFLVKKLDHKNFTINIEKLNAKNIYVNINHLINKQLKEKK